jgi:hypothetical protein
MSDPKTVFHAAIDAAESGPFTYLVYGGLAAALWGEPRYTEDVDLVLFLPEREAYKFLRASAKCGFAVDEELAIQQVQVNGWARLPLGSKESAWHMDLTLGDTPFDQSALKRRREVLLFNRKVWIVSPEDLILYKLVSARDRDLSDVGAVGRHQKDLDAAYLRQWAAWWEKEGVAGVVKGIQSALGSK